MIGLAMAQASLKQRHVPSAPLCAQMVVFTCGASSWFQSIVKRAEARVDAIASHRKQYDSILVIAIYTYAVVWVQTCAPTREV